MALALETNQLAILEVLLAHPATDIVTYNGEPLWFTLIKRGHEKALQILLSRSDFNPHVSYKDRPLCYALVGYGYVDILEKLLSQNWPVDLNLKGNNNLSSFHLAVKKGFTKVVKIMLTNYPGVNVNEQPGGFAYTPLYSAAMLGHLEIVQALLEHSAIKPELPGIGSTTPLQVAKLQLQACTSRLEKDKYQALS